jgi:hypothetical protein
MDRTTIINEIIELKKELNRLKYEFLESRDKMLINKLGAMELKEGNCVKCKKKGWCYINKGALHCKYCINNKFGIHKYHEDEFKEMCFNNLFDIKPI